MRKILLILAAACALLPLSAQEADQRRDEGAATSAETVVSGEVSESVPAETIPEPETVQEAPVPLDDDMKQQSNGGGWLLSLALALSVIGLAFSVLAFLQSRRNQRFIDRLLKEGITMSIDQQPEKPAAVQPAATPAAAQPAARPRPRERRESERREPERHEPERRTAVQPQTFFLSRPDDNDCFLRVTTEFEPGNSIFRLDTTDGVNGSFAVIDNPDVHRFALMMPTQNLTRACSGNAIQVSDGKRRIVTDRAGKASFENGVWHITVKAIIHYE